MTKPEPNGITALKPNYTWELPEELLIQAKAWDAPTKLDSLRIEWASVVIKVSQVISVMRPCSKTTDSNDAIHSN